jgi:hypothetical protein
MQIESDDLAYWFFRLNGFLSIVNFVVHTDRRGETGTDADILGVRFPYRAELFERPMPDYREFTKITSRPYIAIAEVKRGLCNLNGPWTSPERRNIQRVLRAVGALPLEDVDIAAERLYEQGCYKNENYYISLICLGETINPEVRNRYPLVPQILWSDIKSFIYQRFRNYRNVKSWHQHWDENGHHLWNWFESSRDEQNFVSGIELRS